MLYALSSLLAVSNFLMYVVVQTAELTIAKNLSGLADDEEVSILHIVTLFYYYTF